MKEIEEIKNDLIRRMKERYPGCSWTVRIICWDDGTYRITCQHGTTGEIGKHMAHIVAFEWYKGVVNYIEYDVCSVEGHINIVEKPLEPVPV